MATGLVCSALLQVLQILIQISIVLDLSIAKKTELFEMRIWCTKLDILSILH
jgi:hypothetical protein